MIEVKFGDAQEVRDGEGVVTQSLKAGQVVEMNNASARYWINRGMALDVRAAAQDARQEAKAAEEDAVADAPVEPEKPAEVKAEVKTGDVDPTLPKRGRGRPRSA